MTSDTDVPSATSSKEYGEAIDKIVARGPKSQVASFRQAARELGTDESEEAFDRALKKVGSAPPAPVHKPAKAVPTSRPKHR